MRVQIDPKLMRLLRQAENQNLRNSVRSLRIDHYPEWATEASDKPGEYHFLADDILVAYRIDDNEDMEKVIQVVLIE